MSEQKIEQAADLLKAIAHPVRLRILLLLTQQPSINVSTLQEQLDIGQTLLSHHLIKMKDRGVLVSIRQGQGVYYSLADGSLIKALSLLMTNAQIQ